MKRVLALALGMGIALFILGLGQFAWAQESGKQVLRVSGAGMSSDQVDKWAQRFMQTNPDISVIVIGSSAGKGFQALLDGSTHIAMMSREVSASERQKASEKGIKLAEKPIGHAGIALITHPRNPVNDLTLEQARKLYAGEYSNWSQVGGPDEPVRCLTRRIPESGGAVFFWTKVLDGEPFGKGTVFTESWEAIIKVCSAAQDLPVGIIPQTRNLSSVKVLGVKVLGVKYGESGAVIMPRDENIKNGSYPITLAFSFAWDERSESPALKRFVEFCRSQGGL